MAVPEFNEIKAPALQFFFKNPTPHKASEVYDVLAGHFKLTEADLSEVLPSGKQRRWHNRVNWALSDLFRAALLDRPSRGLYVITTEGKKIALENPPMIDRDYLMKTSPQFAALQQASGRKKGEAVGTKPLDAIATDKTPEELIDAAFEQLNASLRKDVLDSVNKMDPFRFEQLVVDLLVKMGYGGSREEAARVTKASGDEGIDGIINEDRLGLDVIYIQAKRWQNDVGRREIQNFVGALAGKKAEKGIFITTSGFNKNARDYVNDVHQKVILVDGERLADLMIEHDIGVSISQAFTIKKIDSDYFGQE